MARKQEQAEQAVQEDQLGEVYTYIGGGEDAPYTVNFMGKQEFVRGKATSVTDPLVLSKIAANPCFRKGEVSAEEMGEIESASKKLYEGRMALYKTKSGVRGSKPLATSDE